MIKLHIVGIGEIHTQTADLKGPIKGLIVLIDCTHSLTAPC